MYSIIILENSVWRAWRSLQIAHPPPNPFFLCSKGIEETREYMPVYAGDLPYFYSLETPWSKKFTGG